MTDSLLLNAISWAREAGAVHLRYFRGNQLEIKSKFNDSDIVTAADKAAEKLIIDHIKSTYPHHSILSEESGLENHDSEYRWVIDPLDGTTNFSQGLPQFSVSIGIEHNGVTEIGVVYAAYLNELFHAIRGRGAYMNGELVKVSGKARLDQCVVATGFPVDKDRNPDNNVDNLTRVLPHVRGMRRLGSAAIDLCYVGAGFLDGYWELNLHQWDVSAGLLFVEEAGGSYTHFRTDRNVSVLAGTPAIHDQLLPMLSTEAATK
ncbi:MULTISPECIES: inositol monophosphatase family protein [Muribaculum]|jgi:archaeal fructose-1,6-bisphosphatase and related enzymes of inositol monophosphatase family|uniref:inositol monophosphatase family protein n=3 Tax=Muribaculaceae TaxID=2005473 RepID=UPI000F497479|nr:MULTISPECIES: inositol monophosphatase family protein [Muribaculum]MCX4278442.1 inositol monophosphatase family protein [Muribaculum sp.]ROT16077.1 inositol monophosphatase [Muribaculaceae bacterium Isolate-102 (HZI)]TGY05252.1 inositol monophosphatase [Muribaculum sp. NM65_B17]THG44509.1 inositol monophosphatase [Muribaculaceae bacterium]